MNRRHSLSYYQCTALKERLCAVGVFVFSFLIFSALIWVRGWPV